MSIQTSIRRFVFYVEKSLPLATTPLPSPGVGTSPTAPPIVLPVGHIAMAGSAKALCGRPIDELVLNTMGPRPNRRCGVCGARYDLATGALLHDSP